MTTFVALLRGVNVGGHAILGMAELRARAAASGLRVPRTILQSGNLVIEADALSSREIEQRLEASLGDIAAQPVPVFVRDAAAWGLIVGDLPFVAAADADPSHVVAMFLRAAPDPQRCDALRAAIRGREQVVVRGTTAFIAYPDGIGRSKLTPALIERHLGIPGTGRNWRTVLKIQAALSE